MQFQKVKGIWLQGYKDQLPLIIAIVPFGLVFGAYAVSTGIPPLETLSLSFLINAGSAQIAALGLIENNVNPFIIVLSICMINLRFMLYSATWAGYMSEIKRSWRVLLSYWLTDATFVLVLNKYQKLNSPDNLWYALGVGFGQWSAWVVSSFLGVFLGAIVPESLSLEFALPLLFISLMIGHLVNVPMLIAALVSGAVSLVFINLPNNLGLLISILIGVTLGMSIESRLSKRNLQDQR